MITAQCARYRRRGKPWHRSVLQNLPDYDIVRIYGAEYRGVVNYYRLAQNVSHLSALRWNAETSMLKTLGAKHKSTVTKTAARYKAKAITGDGPRTCFEARARREGKPDLVARFGGIPLTRDRRAIICDPAPVPVTTPRKELIHRLRRRWCGLCEHGATVAVHHVAASPASANPDQASPRGQPSWRRCGARPHRLRPMPRAHPREPRREHGISHRRAQCTERCPLGWRKAARKRPAPTRERDLTAQPILFDRIPTAGVARPVVDPDYTATIGLDRDQVRALVVAADADRGPQALRTAAVIRLLLHNALRVDEACAADVTDLGANAGHRVLRVLRKGARKARIPLAPATAAALDAYLADRARRGGLSDARQLAGPLLATASGGRLRQGHLWELVRRLARDAGIEAWDQLSPHCQRHSAITFALDAGTALPRRAGLRRA